MQEKKDEGKNAGQQMMVAGPSLSRLSFWFNKLPTSQARSQSGAPNFIPFLAPLCWIQAGPTFLQEVRLGSRGSRGAVQLLEQFEQITGTPRDQDHQRRDEVDKGVDKGPHTIGYPGSIHWSICGLNCFLVLIIKQSETCVC